MDKNLIWDESIDTIVDGYKETKDNFVCLLCGKEFEKGKVYKIKDELYDSYGACKNHISSSHGYTVDYLLDENIDLTGITEIQQKILRLMSKGYDDKQIAKELGIANSTVRNHRYKLREKEKQSKLFVALMESLQDKTSRPINQSDSGKIEEIHKTATMVDDRYDITDSEREKTIKAYISEDGKIKQFPSKEKKKIILLREIMNKFARGKEYSEQDVNFILMDIYEDYATIRRALIEYGFLERSLDCRVYKVKE